MIKSPTRQGDAGVITPEMIEAGLEVWREASNGGDAAWLVEKIYMAMVNQSLLASSTSEVK
jgi:hypothetical protein